MTVHLLNFVLSGTILSAAGSFNSGPTIWHAEKIELRKSFPTVPNTKGSAVAITEKIRFEVNASKNLENAIFYLFETAKELKNLTMNFEIKLFR